MGKFDGYLLGTDLDGTLLRKDKSISDENKKAIEYFKFLEKAKVDAVLITDV